MFKPTIWGGRRLALDFGFDIPEGPVGECWAISAHPHGDCVVKEGPFAGLTLSQLWDERRDLFGNTEGERFPLLVKIIDAADDLSVQVHPDDAYARTHEHGSLGKHECWYVLAAGEGGHIAVGQHTKSTQEFLARAQDGAWDGIVNELPIQAGDFFDIAPGTLHAILGGTLILEIQQSSDVTYRVYDYGRRQGDGTLRETHMARALDVIDFSAQPPVSGHGDAPEIDGVTHLLTCPHFSVDRLRVEGTHSLAQPWPFLCASVISGKGHVSCGGCSRHEARKGDSFVAPGACGDLVFEGNLTIVLSHAT